MRNILGSALAILASLSSMLPQTSQAALPKAQEIRSVATDRVELVMPVLGPFAYTHFCLRYSDECRVRGRAFRRPRPVALTAARRAELQTINADVNRSIVPRRYVDNATFDTWRISPERGDCNDYAITKRHELLSRGWPTRAVLLSEVVTSWGEHHLVLLVRTDHGNFVLDNLSAQIRPWAQTNYRWVRIQMPNEPSLWSTLRDPRRTAMS